MPRDTGDGAGGQRKRADPVGVNGGARVDLKRLLAVAIKTHHERTSHMKRAEVDFERDAGSRRIYFRDETRTYSPLSRRPASVRPGKLRNR
jgi:hypothetical protein